MFKMPNFNISYKLGLFRSFTHGTSQFTLLNYGFHMRWEKHQWEPVCSTSDMTHGDAPHAQVEEKPALQSK